MNILAPLSNCELTNRFINAGATEFYLGFHDKKWTKKFGIYADINRMSGFGTYANSTSILELEKTINYVHACEGKIYITLNANAYNPSQINYIKENYLPIIKNADGVIVSSSSMAKLMLSWNIEPVASTMCGIYNEDIAMEYYKIGVKRMILPRDLSLSEISAIIKKFPQCRFEVFFMRNGCILSDGYCLGMHRPECGATCAMLRGKKEMLLSNMYNFREKHDTIVNSSVYRNMFFMHACGLCALYRLKKCGVHSLKIVGRADDILSLENDIRLTDSNMKIASECQNEKEYLAKMTMPMNGETICQLSMSCYYPEIRFGRSV